MIERAPRVRSWASQKRMTCSTSPRRLVSRSGTGEVPSQGEGLVGVQVVAGQLDDDGVIGSGPGNAVGDGQLGAVGALFEAGAVGELANPVMYQPHPQLGGGDDDGLTPV